MDILTLELFDLALSQAILEVHRALQKHHGRLRLLFPPGDTLRNNLEKLVTKGGRTFHIQPHDRHVQMDIAPLPAKPLEPLFKPTVTPQATTALASPPAPRQGLQPVVVLHSAFTPGDRALGRRLLLGVLQQCQEVPWLMLAHEGLELLEDPTALALLEQLHDQGLTIQLSRQSLHYLNKTLAPFEIANDESWQKLLARGEITVL